MTVLGLIPARGGSKGIPGKNLADLEGRPLIAWTIEVARTSQVFDKIVVSTDDAAIAEAAQAYGAEVPFMRPLELAKDDTPSMAVVQHALKSLQERGFNPETLVLLQPTSPFRAVGDIVECLSLHRRTSRPVVSISPVKLHPSWLFERDESGGLHRHLLDGDVASRRQEAAPLFAPNGAVYVAEVAALARGSSLFDDAIGYEMPAERSLDIDEPFDLTLARLIAAAHAQRTR